MWTRAGRGLRTPAVFLLSALLPVACQGLSSNAWLLQSSGEDLKRYLISELTFYTDASCSANVDGGGDFIYNSEGCDGPKLSATPAVLTDGVCYSEVGRPCAARDQDFQACPDPQNGLQDAERANLHQHYIGMNFTEEVEIQCVRVCQPLGCAAEFTSGFCAYAWDPKAGDIGGWRYQGMAQFGSQADGPATSSKIDKDATNDCELHSDLIDQAAPGSASGGGGNNGPSSTVLAIIVVLSVCGGAAVAGTGVW
eukprot:CAMPEP_0198204998 /NCGR_PEP_ID=MMETSP1445-20131203/8484_1 /TAXON_ID=36898 /ORGANISM="Pyramimonas sp., Strain CCMP2087" /LENGTH=252 /DNA_ID=CAMNT_0043877127 /DNA_START=151 /DNA_END=906 /DNA_ORIENTATION=-